jgi:hypothetical protein
MGYTIKSQFLFQPRTVGTGSRSILCGPSNSWQRHLAVKCIVTRLLQDTQCTYNATLTHVHGTIVALEKQQVLHICVCVCVGVCARARGRAHGRENVLARM